MKKSKRGKMSDKNLIMKQKRKLRKLCTQNQFTKKLKKSIRNRSKCQIQLSVKNNLKTLGTFTSQQIKTQ